jgi:Na+-translocating ferredoxin:NAD+ oxidoreductase RnfC subunit
MSSLKKECGNCYRVGGQKCVPMEVPIPNFDRIDREMERLEQQEAEADEAESAALQAIMAARAKKDRIRKQKKMLKRREQQWVDETGQYVEDIEALEAIEGINHDVAQLEDGLMPGSLALDWSAFMPSVLEGDPSFPSFEDTETRVVGSS